MSIEIGATALDRFREGLAQIVGRGDERPPHGLYQAGTYAWSGIASK